MPASVRTCVAGVCAALACRAALAASAPRVDPAEWNYGVRAPYHVVTGRLEVRPADGGTVRIGMVQIACECLKARVVRASGTADVSAEISVDMYTEDFRGATKHSVFVALEEPAETVLRADVVGWVRRDGGAAKVDVFYAPGEGSAAEFLAWWGTPGRSAAVAVFPIDDVANYTRLRELERAAGLTGAPADVVAFVDEEIALVGFAQVRQGLAGLLDIGDPARPGRLDVAAAVPTEPAGAAAGTSAAAQPTSATPVPSMQAASVSASQPAEPGVSAAGASLEMRLYHFSDCRRCRDVIAAVRAVAGAHGDAVSLRIVDCDREYGEIPNVFAAVAVYADAPRVLPSAILLAGSALVCGEREIVESAREVVERQLERGGAHLAIPRPSAARDASEPAGAVSVVPVVLAALADGVNPCAFAAIVLLVSVLGASRAGSGGASSARDLVLGGGAFCLGVFATYFAAGLALLSVMGGLGGFPRAREVLFWVVWALAAGGAVASVADAIVYYRTGDPSRLTLKVPERLRALFAPVMRSRLRRLGLVAGGFAAGAAIAILEGVCTGQMYLPTIQYMARTEGLRLRGVAFLLVYNVLFVLPLIAILAAAAAGVHVHRLSAFLRRNIGACKVAMAVVYAVLAVVLIAQR